MKSLQWNASQLVPTAWYGSSFLMELYLELERLPPALPPVPRRLARHGCQVSGPGRGEVPAAAVFAKLGQHERVSLWEFALATEMSELDGVGGH